MLKKRSRPVSSTKQGLMADPFPLSSPNGSKPRSSPLFYPRLFVGFSSKGFSEANEVAMSPTSILETKPFSPTANPFFSDKNPKKPLVESSIQDSKHQPVGLGIVDELKKSSSPDSRMVLFGSQLKIQIPSITATGTADCPQSPIEFGIKNRNSQLALLSPARRSPMGSSNLVSGSLSATEMEMSEDYTCVIAHGPNPKTTHIFDNCIIESCCGGQGFVAASAPRKEKGFPDDRDRVSGYRSNDFLDFCHACKRSLGLGKDIFMYRGDKAFCSRECRYQEMLFDGGMEDCTPDPSTIL